MRELIYRKVVKNQTDFAEKLGYNKTYISRLFNEHEPMSDKIATEMETVFKLQKHWLMTGKGGADPVFLTSPSGPTSRPTTNAFPLGPTDDDVTERSKSGNEFISIGAGRWVMLVPKVDQFGYGGYLVGYKDPEYIEHLPKHSIIVNEKHRGRYRSFEMRGDSMYNGEEDSIKEGDTVTGREINKQYWTSKLHIHKYKEYIIVHKEGIIIKEIIAHDPVAGIITIHSKNPDKTLYPDEQISLADVNELHNVIEVSKPRR